MSVFGLAFILDFAVILKSSFAMNEIRSGVGTRLQGNFQQAFDRGRESSEEEKHIPIPRRSLLLVVKRSLRKGEIA